ncbi:adhesion G-protein coupled receptor F3-like [Alosa pseudoharengus]|uniref:adhesion G-protein coupled receptor F3-like n=1 Tax=Alosa pseudoharengus TaxID=34774 RepID=UPI003F8B9DDB
MSQLFLIWGCMMLSASGTRDILHSVPGEFHFSGEFMIEGNSTLTVNLEQLKNLELVDSANNKIGTIEEAEQAAECRIIGDETTCWCESEYIWDKAVFEDHESCRNNLKCVANVSHYTPLCNLKVSIQLEGTMTKHSSTSTIWNAGLNTSLANVFNKMNGFESLITTVDTSGLKADFAVNLTALFNTSTLNELIESLSLFPVYASTEVETTGLVEMSSPSGKIPYGKEEVELTCNLNIDDPMSSCSWFILKTSINETSAIGNGTQVEVGSWCSNVTRLLLRKPKGLWRGVYTCKFTEGSVSHKATGEELEIDLLPDKITMTSDLSTADCTVGSSTSVAVKVKCAIPRPTTPVNYTVTFNTTDGNKELMDKVDPAEKTDEIWYIKPTTISCADKKKQSQPMTCLFENSSKQNKKQELNIPILQAVDRFCEPDLPWQKTKAGEKALMECPVERVGYRIRPCNVAGEWQSVLDYCVNEVINKLSSAVENFQTGLDATPEIAMKIFSGLKNNSASGTNMSLGDITATINILDGMKNASSAVTLQDDSMMNDFIDSASNILSTEWTDDNTITQDLSTNYLQAVEGLVTNMKVNQSDGHNSSNVQFQVCRNDDGCNRTIFGVEMALTTTAQAKVVALKNLSNKLPNRFNKTESASIVVSATLENTSDHMTNITLIFPFNKTTAHPGYKIKCVFWHTNRSEWSDEGCVWTENEENIVCECSHLTSFSSLISKEEVDHPFLDMITYIGLGISICSLLVFLFIEWLVWSAIVKSNLSLYRHTSLANIAASLLLANCCFLASAFPEKLGKLTCFVLVLAKHFFFTAMFFWMLCLSLMLLHQLIFVFSPLRKRVFMILSFTVGYGSPTVVVGVSYVYYDVLGKEPGSSYHNPETCWLRYEGLMKGSLYAFLFPVGVITLMNLISMVVVIITLLRPKVSEGKTDDKETLRSIIKAIVFLTPVFGGTWLLAVVSFTINEKTTLKVILDYAFTIVNSLQGFLILVTGCLGEKRVREEVLRNILGSRSTKSESKQNLTTSIKK